MLFSKTILLSLAFALFTDAAAVPDKRDGKKVLSFDLNVKDPLPVTPDTVQIIKRDEATQEVTLTNRQYYYSIDVAFGSNKQKVTLDIDTGSSDTWVVNALARCGTLDYNSCKVEGVFRPSKSTTFKSLYKPVYLGYGSGLAIGVYAKEDLWLPSGDKVEQLQIVDVKNANKINLGLLGVGLKGTEGSRTPYDNLPYALKNQGLINTVGYSLYLNDITAKKGKVIFGGYDTEKISGPFPDIPLSSETRLSIPLRTLEFNGTQIDVQSSALLDSGTTYTYLPTEIAKTILESLATYSEQYQTYTWSCDQPSDKFLTYKFDGVDIKVPYSALVQIVQDPTTYEIVQGVCQPGIVSGGSTTILGDTFLRSAYIVYNFETKSIKIGQASYSDKENIVEL